jgi:hypothetical protein
VTIEQAQMSKGTQTCYNVNIPQAELKTVEQNWVKKLGENNKAKVQTVGTELVMTGALKTELWPDSLNIYSLLIQRDSSINLYFFMEIDSVFFTPSKEESNLVSDKTDNHIRNYLRNFAIDQYRLSVTEELETQQKVLKSLQNDLQKLEKNEQNLKKDNASLENKIEKKEREIISLEKDVELKNGEIQALLSSSAQITDKEEKKAFDAKHKELEKDRDKMEKDRTSAKDDISAYELKIENNDKDIEISLADQESKKEEISKQEEIISQIEIKLNNIK